MKTVGRIVYGLIRIGIMLLPLVILVMGIGFLRRCLQALASPSAGLDFTYEARKGAVLHITAESYSFLWQPGVLQVVHPRLQDAGGQLLAEADSARIAGLKINYDGAIDATVRNLSGKLVRLPNGHFALEEYLPEKTPQAQNRSYHVRIDGANILYEDRSGSGIFDQRVLSNELVVEGMGDNFLASGEMNMPKAGMAGASVQRYKNVGLLVSINSRQFNLTRILNHFKTTPEGRNLDLLKKISAGTLVADGPFRLFFPENNPFFVSGSVKAHASDVLYDGKDHFDDATFDGLVTADGASGTLVAARGGSAAKFVGATDWSNGANFAGQLTANVRTRSDIPPSLSPAVPKTIRFANAQVDGWLTYNNELGFQYDGNVDAQNLSVGGQQFDGVSGKVVARDQLIRIEDAQGVWRHSPLHGSLAYSPASKSIDGLVAGPQIALHEVAQYAHFSGLSGTSDAEALLSGTIDKPVAAIRANGTAAFRAPKAAKTIHGDFAAAAQYSQNGLDLTSLTVITKTGTVAATGHANIHGALALKVAASGVNVGAFAPDISGEGSFSGTLAGTSSNPQVTGQAEIVDLNVAHKEIPLVVADVTADKTHIKATNLRASRGAAEANGQFAYNFNNGSIYGILKANNLPLSEVNDQISGVIDVPGAVVKGTLASPIVDANVQTHSVSFANRNVGRGKAKVALRGSEFTATEISADFAGGTVAGSASGNLKTKATQLNLVAQDLSIPEMFPEALQTVDLDGKLSGNATLSLVGANITHAQAKGDLSTVTVNQTLVGNGSWNATAEPDSFSGAIQVGTLDRYLDAPKIAVDRKTNNVAANFTAYHIPLQDIYSAANRYLPTPTSELERRLYRLSGTVDAEAGVSGNLTDPNLQVSILNLSNLALEGRDLGEMKFTFDKSARIWTVADAEWNGQEGTLRASGSIDLDKDMKVEGDFTNVDLGLLSILNDNLARIGGRAALSFLVSGPTADPTVQASLDASRTTFLTSTGEVSSQLEFGMVLDTATVSQSKVGPDGKLTGGIEASGKLFYRGLEGNINAQVPLKYPFSIPPNDPISVTLDFPQRSLQSLSDYFPGLDAKRTDGTIQGTVAMTGTANKIDLNGSLNAQAKTFAVNKVQTTLNDAVATAQASTQGFALHLAGTSSEGGTVLFDASSPIDNASDLITDLSARGLDSLLDRPISGSLALNDFAVRYNGGANGGRLVAKTNATIKAEGPLRQPAVTGNATISGVNAVMPSFDVVSAPPITYAINPTFDVKMHMADVADVSTSLAKLNMIGDGAVEGSLNEPTVSSNFTVMGGTVSLPTTSVRIDPGGTVRFSYQETPGGESLANLNVDLTGRTTLTTLDAGDIPQRYDITLSIRGDLLQDGETFMTAESDPPGLSQDRILALLGQADLIQALAGGVTTFQASRELRNALAGYAVPALLSPFTGAFAKGLGLDYLNISYDPLNQVSISFAKQIGKNFTFQGTRQVSQPLPGIKPQFDLRLVYRLPFKGKTLRRTTISFGADQDRPWKFGIQYGIRF